ncbi:hypothetical protein, partial [Streptomyces sp. NPDC059814]|uniref:hypothetical protein n=1 Tax=Streptomyces sp. NPDC059814 TaxID=3346959 RepID=UPI0036567047
QYRDLLRTDQARYHSFRHELLKRGVHTNAYGKAPLGEPDPPGTGRVQVQARPASDARVGACTNRVEDDLGAYPQSVLSLVTVGGLL